jgi:hypothetical protein
MGKEAEMHREARFYTPLSTIRCDDCGECRACRISKAQGALDTATDRQFAAERDFHRAMSEYVAAQTAVILATVELGRVSQ